MVTGVATDEESDRALVQRAQAGDLRAFDLLVIKYQHRLLSVISKFVKDSDEAQDVAQEAFIKAFKALDNFRGESAFYTWLYRIATNTAKNHLVARSRRAPSLDWDIDEAVLYDESDRLHEVDTPEANLAREELKLAIDAAVNDLPDELRTAFYLREFDGLSYEDIAAIMDCPIGTVRSRIFRGRETIDSNVAAQLSGESAPQRDKE